MKHRRFVLVVPLLALGACAPANVAGNYTINTTSGQNGCNLNPWTVGGTTMGTVLQVSQNGSSITGNVTDLLSQIALDAQFGAGNHAFTGSVNGSSIEMTINGTAQKSQGGCNYTVNGRVDGSLSGDTLTGTITYTIAPINAASCSALQNCQSVQNFNGSRPPM